nr:hypothetical protein [Tanacetum cinerariifolium]
MENLLKVGETNALSKPVTSNSVSTPRESKGVNNDKMIATGMFRINLDKTSRDEKHVPNTVSASARTKSIIVSQPPVFTNKDVNSDSNVTSNLILTLQESKVVKNNKVIAPGMFRIHPFKTYREEKHVPNTVRASSRTTSITVLQPPIISKKDVNSDSNGLSSTGIDNTKTRRPQPRSNTKNDRVPSASKSSRSKNKGVKVEEHHRNLLLLKNTKHMSSACNNIKLDSQNVISKVVCTMCLPKFKYHKEHLFPSCELGKSKRASYPPKPVPNSRQRLHLRHMDLCGPMRIASINGKRNVLVIVDDYSRYTWVHFLRSKDETPEVIKTFLKRITVLLHVGISHQVSSIRTPQQNVVVERRNQTLVEAARTMLIFSHAPLILWAEAIATACFTQNRSIIHYRFNKTSYKLINGRKPNISFLHVFGALCYHKNDREYIRKLSAKGDIGFFIGYYANSCAYKVFNRRTKKIIETMNVSFDELLSIVFEQRSSKPEIQSMISGQISLGLDLTYAPSTITTQQPTEGELDLLFEAMYDDYIGGQPSATVRTILAAQEPQDHPLEQVIEEPSRPVLTRNQLRSDGDMCMYALTLSTMEPKNVKEAMTDPAWIESMQEELLQFKRLDA